MNKQDIQDIKQLLSSPKKVVIVPHKNPDGDAMGSSLGLFHYLNKLHHNVQIIAPNDYPKFLKWLPGDSTVMTYESSEKKSNELIENAYTLM